jgi:hypothetical protein
MTTMLAHTSIVPFHHAPRDLPLQDRASGFARYSQGQRGGATGRCHAIAATRLRQSVRDD